jgi:hypothetical protein
MDFPQVGWGVILDKKQSYPLFDDLIDIWQSLHNIPQIWEWTLNELKNKWAVFPQIDRVIHIFSPVIHK